LDIEESNIIKACKKGKRNSKELLYRLYYSYGMSICLRYSYSKEEAIEILNDGFLKIFENINKYDENREFKPWSRRIFVNTAIDYYRKSKKIVFFKDYDFNEQIESEAIDMLSVDEILGLLNRIPEIYRVTFNLYEIEGYSHDEIAQLLETTPGNSRSNLTRAKKMLRDAYIQFHKLNYNEAV